jgi:hypothetical protein
MPICTLPMLNGKMYVINSPTLISAATRCKELTFEPFVLEFTTGVLGLSKRHIEVYSKPGFLESVTPVVHSSMTGDELRKMMARGLTRLSSVLNAIKPGTTLEVDNSLRWFRDVMSQAIMYSLFGKNNPMGPEEIAALWYVIKLQQKALACFR